MERHCRGSGYGLPLDALRVTTIDTTGSVSRRLHSVEAAIVKDELLLRVQYWTVFDDGKAMNLKRYICAHISLSEDFTTEELQHCKSHHPDRECDSLCNPTLLACDYCSLEFNVERKRMKDLSNAVIVTKCFSLGNGRPSQAGEWQRHLHRIGGDGWTKPIKYNDSKGALFTAHAEKSRQKITGENEAYFSDEGVKNRCRKGLMGWGPACEWAGGPSTSERIRLAEQVSTVYL